MRQKIHDLPTLTVWARKQCDGTADQVDEFLAALDRQQVVALDAVMRDLARALRAWCRADDQLSRYALMAGVVRALQRDGLEP